MTRRPTLSRWWHLSIVLLVASLMSACVSYSFSGASIPIEAKTISIQYFDNKANFVVPTLSSTLTTAIEDKFTSQTNLILVKQAGDLQIEGYISEYNITPQAITGNETAALTRLSISIKAKYTNTFEPDKDYEKTFTRYEDFDASSDISSVQESLIESVVEMLADDIFNKSVVNW